MKKEKTIGTVLRELRKKKKMTVQEATAALAEKGFVISCKSMYAYENDTREMNADPFIALCQIYDCDNVMETFADAAADDSLPTEEETKLLQDYRLLDRSGQETVLYILAHELDRQRQISPLGEKGDQDT